MVVWKPNILFQISYLPTSPCQCCILRREIYNSLVYLEKQKRSRENSTQPKEELVVSPFMSLFVRIHSASLPSSFTSLSRFPFSLASLQSTLSLAILHSFSKPPLPLLKVVHCLLSNFFILRNPSRNFFSEDIIKILFRMKKAKLFGGQIENLSIFERKYVWFECQNLDFLISNYLFEQTHESFSPG